MKKEFAKVIVDISHEKVDRPFGYRIPERLADSVTPGCLLYTSDAADD